MITLEQQIADEVARILAFDNLSTQVPLSNAWMEALARHLINNRPASFVNVQLLEALTDLRDWIDESLTQDNGPDLAEANAAIHAADVVETEATG